MSPSSGHCLLLSAPGCGSCWNSALSQNSRDDFLKQKFNLYLNMLSFLFSLSALLLVVSDNCKINKSSSIIKSALK